MRNKQRKAAKKEQQKKAAKEEEEKKKEANKPKTENEPDVPRLETLDPEKLARVGVAESRFWGVVVVVCLAASWSEYNQLTSHFLLFPPPSNFPQPSDALEMACHFLRPLQTFAAREIETHLLAFEVFVRRDKILLMLQSIKRAHDLDPHHPVLHFQKSLFIRKCKHHNVIMHRTLYPRLTRLTHGWKVCRCYLPKVGLSVVILE